MMQHTDSLGLPIKEGDVLSYVYSTRRSFGMRIVRVVGFTTKMIRTESWRTPGTDHRVISGYNTVIVNSHPKVQAASQAGRSTQEVMADG